jgi:hypothetical protein
MKFRGLVKKALFGSAPFLRGHFPYYGRALHFRVGSTFERACAEGIYERDSTYLILAFG